MKNNLENIPGEIFDWIVEIPFEALDVSKKRSVLQYFTKEEYDELHESNINIKNTLHLNKRFDTHKADLMKLYDEKYKTQHSSLKLNSSILWKAASVLFFVSTLWLALKKTNEDAVSRVAIAKKDTVFIEKQLASASQKTDTVYLPESSGIKPAKKQVKKLSGNKEALALKTSKIPEKTYAVLPPADNDFQVLPVGSIDNVSNAVKRNSMHDDSLEKNFKFVSM